jgi:hypothetical protein
MKQRGLRRIARRSTGTVPVQPLEVEHTGSEPEHPALDGARYDARRAGDARQRHLVDRRLPDRVQDHLDARYFSRQRLERQHALAMPTIAAACERHLEHHGCAVQVEPALDSAPSKSQVAAATSCAATAGKQLVSRGIDDRGVLARLHVEYENQVLVTAPG